MELILVLLPFALLFAGIALAQGNPTSTLTGRVINEGQGLPGVTVNVKSPTLQGTRTAVTSVNGDFVLPQLPPGDYTVTFKTFYLDSPAPDGLTQAIGTEITQLEVYHGGSMPISGGTMKLGKYQEGGDFVSEGVTSPYTLETGEVSAVLPPWPGWDYRILLTLTTSGAPATPDCGSSWSCTASLWVTSVTAMVKGRVIEERSYRTPTGLVGPATDCPAYRGVVRGFHRCAANDVPPWEKSAMSVMLQIRFKPRAIRE